MYHLPIEVVLDDVGGLVHNCSNSSALAMEFLRFAQNWEYDKQYGLSTKHSNGDETQNLWKGDLDKSSDEQAMLHDPFNKITNISCQYQGWQRSIGSVECQHTPFYIICEKSAQYSPKYIGSQTRVGPLGKEDHASAHPGPKRLSYGSRIIKFGPAVSKICHRKIWPHWAFYLGHTVHCGPESTNV